MIKRYVHYKSRIIDSCITNLYYNIYIICFSTKRSLEVFTSISPTPTYKGNTKLAPVI